MTPLQEIQSWLQKNEQLIPVLFQTDFKILTAKCWELAPKGQNVIAQGNALGVAVVTVFQPCRGEMFLVCRSYCVISPLQGCNFYVVFIPGLSHLAPLELFSLQITSLLKWNCNSYLAAKRTAPSSRIVVPFK